MKARPLLNERHQLRADAFVELRIWLAPKPVRGSVHRLKYALAYVVVTTTRPGRAITGM
jgi:hypothetical protein